MKKFLLVCGCLVAVLSAARLASAAGPLYSENFDSVLPLLGESVNERVGTDLVTRVATDPASTPFSGVWSNSAPGWTRNNNLTTYDGSPTIDPGVAGQGVADYGVDEWEGWSFPRLDFWQEADQQDREDFGDTTGAAGTIAVADPDEYYDLGDPDDPTHGGYYSAGMTSPSVSVSGGEFYGVGFDSSWRDESFDDSTPLWTNLNNQAVEIVATFDVGGSVQVTKWNSDAVSPDFKNDAPDENVPPDGSTDVFFQAPAGATSATLTFSIANAGNDWWWAVDNIEVQDITGGAGQVFSEDFEGVTLGDSINERLGAGAKVTSAPGSTTTVLGVAYPTSTKPDAFTHTAPAGVTVDTTIDVGNQGDNNIGVLEWEQWSFTTPEFWTFADTQEREQFTKGSGVIAVADGDEWTDLGSPTGKLLTLLETPEIDLTGVGPDELVRVRFDSGWRSEGGQIGILTALLDGAPVELFRWEGDDDILPGGDRNRTVDLLLDPGDADSLKLVFSYEGGNNWWWAIDNIRVSSVVPEPSSVLLTALAAFCGLIGAGGRRRG